MAKKSAKSKGYRKQTAKKPYLSKRDIVLLCVLVAAVAVAAILLFRYDDGALKVQDGAVVTEGDNWLIVNGSGTRGGARYFKLGEVDELEGFTREAKPAALDANIPEYAYTAEAEDAPVQTVRVTTSHTGASSLADRTLQMLAELDTAEAGAKLQAEIDGHTVHYFIYSSSPAETEEAESTAEEAEPAEDTADTEDAEATDEEAEADAPYHRELCAYIDASHGSCLLLRVDSGADAPEDCADDDALMALLEQAVAAVTLEEGK